MTNQQAVEFNCTTGEVTTRDFTPEEIAANELAKQEYAEMIAATEALTQAKAEAKASGIAKLLALGLSEEEANALAN